MQQKDNPLLQTSIKKYTYKPPSTDEYCIIKLWFKEGYNLNHNQNPQQKKYKISLK